MKKIIILIIVALILWAAWFLLSPIWRTTELDEPLPQAPGVVIKDNLQTMDEQTVEMFKKETEKMKDDVMTKDEVMPQGGPVVLAEAPMVERAHSVSGKALLVEVNGQKFLRFENLDTINGPDLRIYLSSDLGNEDFIDLGAIRATQGNVNYPIPAGTDTDKYKNALIWCRAFGVLFSYAQL